MTYLYHPGSSKPEYYPLGFESFNTTLIHIYVWSKHLQVDFLGCNTADPVDRFKGDNLKSFQFVPLAVQDLPEEGTVIGNNIVTQLDCGKLCFGQKSCVTFSVDTETGQCVGYETNIYGNVLQRERHLQPLLERRSFYFFNFGLTRMLTDYEQDVTAVLMYRVYTSRKTQLEAALFCSNYSADLLIISTIPQLDSVQTKINSSTVLRHEGPYYVGGSNTTGVWQYGENWTIPDNLWSSSPTTTSGQCVVLTNDGLSSYECDEKLFFICGI
ncbi:uncharacterized protein [Argopecten irradians]|uniref:uncharacterized protein n=1 Tax=Argopecten irradians TaxID=31199 RepID=UPI003715B6EC